MKKQKKTSNYIISSDTFMLQPSTTGNTLSTLVVERNGELSVPKKPIQIVKNSCDYYGGSLQGSTNSAKLALRNRHKTPIIVAHDFGIPYIFLPTMSPNSEYTTWISYHAIDHIEPDPLGSIIYMENNHIIKLNISAATMFRQLSLAKLLEKKFLQKQRQLNRPSSFGRFNHSDEE